MPFPVEWPNPEHYAVHLNVAVMTVRHQAAFLELASHAELLELSSAFADGLQAVHAELRRRAAMGQQ